MSSSESSFSGFDEDEVHDIETRSIRSDFSVSSVATDDLSFSLSDLYHSSEPSDTDTSDSDSDDNEFVFSEELTDITVQPFVPYPAQLQHNIDFDTGREIDYFKLFWSDNMIDNMVTQTNLYAEQLIVEAPDASWYPTTKQEMDAFIGLNILQGIDAKPELSMYWSTDKFFGNVGVQETMSRDRYKDLSKYLHVNDNRTAVPHGEPGYDALHKIARTLSDLRSNMKNQFNPGCALAIDEAMVAYKGRSYMKQYLPSKPTKWGFKIWSIADSKSGYLCDIDIYTGKRANPSRNGLGYDVVMKLGERYLGRYHHLYYDNLFSSLPLAQDLLKQKTYCCSTIRPNRAGLPQEIKKPGKLARGASVKRQCGNITATVWHDKRDVRLLSSNSQPVDTVVKRRVGGRQEDVACPEVVVNYNKNMGGVDLADQHRAYYEVGRKAKKYWKSLLWFLMNVAVVNSYIVYRETFIERGKKPNTHLEFRKALLKQMIGGFSSRKRTSSALATPFIEEGNLQGHDLVKAEKRATCKNCSQLGKKTKAGRYVQSTFKCKSCGVHLCKDGCLVEYHARHLGKN